MTDIATCLRAAADSLACARFCPSEAESVGFHTWTEDEIAQFEAHHPIGSKPRLALALLLYTTQRRGDVVRMGRQHIRETHEGRALYVKQRKTGVELLIPIRLWRLNSLTCA